MFANADAFCYNIGGKREIAMRERPMMEMLKAASGRVSCHMPGHKGQAPFEPVDLYALDTTELPVTDDFYAPERAIARAQALYAQAADAGATLFLHNGATQGVHALVQLYAGPGETVLLPRNAHLSAVHGCVLGGIRARWMNVTQRPDGYCYVAEETVLAALAEHPEAKAVLLTRPDYFGGCVPLERIVQEAHARGIRVVVDEAHGAHFPFLSGRAPRSAGELGADAWVQSTHKTLPALTGSAVLHLRNPEDEAAARRILRREQTSSPSFLLMLSLDDARAWMEEKGLLRLASLASGLASLRETLTMLGYPDAHEQWRDTGLQFDPTRLVLTAPQGGAALAEALRQRGIDVEMWDQRRVVCILTAMDGPDTVGCLLRALREIPPTQMDLSPLPKLTMRPERVLEVREAAMGRSESVPLAKCAGRVAAVAAGLYPPGVPLVCPGERITEETAALLERSAPQERFGVEGDTLLCANV